MNTGLPGLKFVQPVVTRLLTITAVVLAASPLLAQSVFDEKILSTEVSCLDAPVVTLDDPDFTVATDAQLQRAVSRVSAGGSILLKPGVYELSKTLSITKPDVIVQGDSARCDDVVLLGAGMENPDFGAAPHGFWINAAGVTIRNLAIIGFYHHAITFGDRATAPSLYNLRLRDSGEQFVKISHIPGEHASVDDGQVEYTLFYYSDAPPATNHGGGGTGYTNGIDVHGGKRWIIRNNYFGNFHTPDSADNRWNPAILMWNGAADTLVENNRFVDVDRAIAFGLTDRDGDHTGGIIRNNMIYYRPGLMNWLRRRDSDAAIVVWNSANTRVIHNTIITNRNVRYSIEFRYHTDGGIAANNLVDASVGSRQGGKHQALSNSRVRKSMQFIQPETGDLRLQKPFQPSYPLNIQMDAPLDYDGQHRDKAQVLLPGADQIN